jgi:hypothetical protein
MNNMNDVLRLLNIYTSVWMNGSITSCILFLVVNYLLGTVVLLAKESAFLEIKSEWKDVSLTDVCRQERCSATDAELHAIPDGLGPDSERSEFPDGSTPDGESSNYPWRCSSRQEQTLTGSFPTDAVDLSWRFRPQELFRDGFPSGKVDFPCRLFPDGSSLMVTVTDDHSWQFLVLFLTVLAVTEKLGWGGAGPFGQVYHCLPSTSDEFPPLQGGSRLQPTPVS